MANLIYAAKKTFIKEQIAGCGKDVKSIFKLMNKLLFHKDELPLPKTENAQTLADSFNDFFTTKITNIIKDLELTCDDQTSSDYIKSSYETSMWLTQFETPSMDNITEIIMKMATKSCEQDPIPTGLIKDCVTTVAPIIQDIVVSKL